MSPSELELSINQDPIRSSAWHFQAAIKFSFEPKIAQLSKDWP